ncbi:MAG: AAA family ATPase [Candidatus Schekmanbacteria bacterium]|nr:AAA family ATPase [Candidatus Schekmanbacteria bacterium]
MRDRLAEATEETGDGPFIGPYRLTEKLGRGGMGVVFAARHRDGGELVALKTVESPSPSRRRAMRREVRGLASLCHPGVAEIVDHGVHDGAPWYAMKLIRGRTLRRMLLDHAARQLPADAAGAASEETAPLPSAGARSTAPGERLGRLLRLVHDLCAPLSYVHGEGYAHFDLKPENIIVDDRGLPILVDFGLLSLVVGCGSRERLGDTVGLGGSLHYLAPELITAEAADARADLYALGVILYEVVTGRLPFAGATEMEVIAQQVHAEPVAPSALAPWLPAELEALILGLLRKNPAERIGYAADVAERLGHLGFAGSGYGQQSPPRTHIYRARFAGREAAFDRLTDWLERPPRSRAAVAVLVAGPAGVGKTRLVGEVGAAARRRGVLVLESECSAQVRPPLGGLAQPLITVADCLAADGRASGGSAVAGWLRVLAEQLPELAQQSCVQAAPAPARLPPSEAALRRNAAITDLLCAVADHRQTVIMLDDAQWADELTLSWLRFFAQTRAGREETRVRVIATYRAERRGEIPGDLSSLEGVATLVLRPLELADVCALVRDHLALPAAPRHFCSFLARLSGGNPLFISEYLRAAVESGAIQRGANGVWEVDVPDSAGEGVAKYRSLSLPAHLEEVVARRIGALGAAARRLAAAAAVLGRESLPEDLTEVAALTEEEALAAAAELVRRFVLEDGAGGGLRFPHDKLRETSGNALAASELAILHGRAAALLERRAGGAGNAEAARHWELSGDGARARAGYLAAARSALHDYSGVEAERLFRDYLRLSSGQAPDEFLVEARVDLATEVLRHAGRIDEALALLAQAEREATALASPPLLRRVLLGLANTLMQVSRHADAAPRLRRVLALARRDGDAIGEARAINSLAIIADDRGQTRTARRRYEKAAAMFAAGGETRLSAVARLNLAHLLQTTGRLDEAERTFAELASVLSHLTDRRLIGGYWVDLAMLRQLQGRLDEAEKGYRRALAIARETSNRIEEGKMLGNLGSIALGRGHPEEALAALDEALVIHRAVGNRRSESIATFNRALVCETLGMIGKARSGLRRAAHLAVEIGDRRVRGWITASLAQLERRAGGDVEAARALIVEATAALTDTADDVGFALAVAERGHCEIALGGTARAALAEVRGAAERLGVSGASELGKARDALDRAESARELGQTDRLLRGECREDYPPALLARLVRGRRESTRVS